MKKIALCSLAVVMCAGGAHASIIKGADCLREFSGWQKFQNNFYAGSDEYLFPTEEDYFKVVNRGTVYECDDSQCGHNTYVEMPDGHFFDGKSKSHAYYKCSLGKFIGLNVGDDKWEKVDKIDGLKKCTKSYKKWGMTGADSDEYLYPTKEDYDGVTKSEYGKVYECDSLVCPQGTEITLGSVHYFGKKRVATPQRYVCVTKNGNDYWQPLQGLCNGKDCEEGKTVAKQCTYEGKKYDVNAKIKDGVPCSGAATADAKTGNTCYLTCMQKLENKGGIIEPLWTVKECPKNAKAVEYSLPEQIYTSNIPGYKKCEGKGGGSNTNPTQPNNPVAPDPVVPGNCEYHFQGTVYCANGNSMNIDKIYPVSEKVLNGKSCSEFNKMYENDLSIVLAYFDELCDGASLAPLGPSNSEVSAATEKLTTFFKSAEANRSGLKTADGKFNTVRLASDLTAGVVLGTVGGVVSGVVIKKKQVEKGFDALHCTVGGQTIADWGDTFEVGLQK